MYLRCRYFTQWNGMGSVCNEPAKSLTARAAKEPSLIVHCSTNSRDLALSKCSTPFASTSIWSKIDRERPIKLILEPGNTYGWQLHSNTNSFSFLVIETIFSQKQ